MDVRHEVSGAVRDQIEIELIRARRDLRENRSQPTKWQPYAPPKWEFAGLMWSEPEKILLYAVRRVFKVFAPEVIRLVGCGAWSISEALSKADEFLRLCVVNLYYDLAASSGMNHSRLIDDWGCLKPEAQWALQRSPEWRRFERDLALTPDTPDQEPAVEKEVPSPAPPSDNDAELASGAGGDSNTPSATEPPKAEPARIEALTVDNDCRVRSNGNGRQRGPNPDYEGAVRVAEIVARIAPDGDLRSKLDDICEAMDDEDAEGGKVKPPKVWARPEAERKYRTWSEAAASEPNIVIKHLKYRVEVAKRRKKP